MSTLFLGLSLSALTFYAGYSLGVKLTIPVGGMTVAMSRDGEKIPTHCICKPVGIPDDEAPKLEYDLGK